MLHTFYLASLCQRRNWPEPRYQITYSSAGYRCIVRVNNREYQTSGSHPSEGAAREGAALIAFNICRSFSANDGMYPTGFAHGGVIQGNPVPVGSGRHSRKGASGDSRSDYRYVSESDSSGSRSGGSSPDFGGKRSSHHVRMPSAQTTPYGSSTRHETRHESRHEPRYSRHTAYLRY